jgi:hypothetical protein
MPIHISARDLKRQQLDDTAAAAQLQLKVSGRPRTARGEGDRQRDLGKLPAAGYTLYIAAGGVRHSFKNPENGATTPARATYCEALDVELEVTGLRG